MGDYRDIEITVNGVGTENSMTGEEAKIEAMRIHIAVSELVTVIEVMDEIKKRILLIEDIL